VSSISKKEKVDQEEDSKAKFTRRSIKETITVCPICFSPTVSQSGLFNRKYVCTNENCNWEGSLAIEVSAEDYKQFVKKREEDSLHK